MTDDPPDIIGRDAASALGLKRFFTGGPCKHGHVAERIVSSHRCTEGIDAAAKQQGISRTAWLHVAASERLEGRR
jgi:hypothetical protein